MSGFRVDLGALERAAEGHDTLAGDFSRLEDRRARANLPQGCLGRLPESDEIQAAFDSRYQGLGDALGALHEIYENIGAGLRATTDGYQGSDDAVADLFRRLLDGS